MISAILLILAIVAYSCSQLQQHNKLRWQDEEKDYFSFWGRNSWVRKYARNHTRAAVLKRIDNPNWYYRLIKSKYRERWFTSTWLTVALTDGYHMCQAVFFLSLSLSFAFALGFSWVKFGLVYGGVHVIHAITYRILQR